METTLTTIENSNLVSTNDIEYIKNNINDIIKINEKKQVFRTETEIHLSVLNDLKFPTKASKYWQSVRELSVMYSELVNASFEYRKLLIDIEELEEKISKETNKFKLARRQIKLEEKLWSKENCQQIASDRMREIKLWKEIMDELDDGTFNTEDVNVHQLESYGVRFKNQASLVNEHTPPADAANILGQAQTAHRYLNLAKLMKDEEKEKIEA